jgi:hypothetical protein
MRGICRAIAVKRACEACPTQMTHRFSLPSPRAAHVNAIESIRSWAERPSQRLRKSHQVIGRAVEETKAAQPLAPAFMRIVGHDQIGPSSRSP